MFKIFLVFMCFVARLEASTIEISHFNLSGDLRGGVIQAETFNLSNSLLSAKYNQLDIEYSLKEDGQNLFLFSEDTNNLTLDLSQSISETIRLTEEIDLKDLNMKLSLANSNAQISLESLKFKLGGRHSVKGLEAKCRVNSSAEIFILDGVEYSATKNTNKCLDTALIKIDELDLEGLGLSLLKETEENSPEKKISDIDIDLMPGQKFKGSLKLKVLFKQKVKLEGNYSYDKENRQIVIDITKAKVVFLNVKKKFLDSLRFVALPNLKVEKDLIYFKL